MKKNIFNLNLIQSSLLLAFLMVGFSHSSIAQDQGTLRMNEHVGDLGLTPPIPISISGFSGDALDVLKFDLYVQGFSFVTPDQAQYQITGSNDGNVIGRIAAAHKEVLARSYAGADVRREAHAFADDIVATITGRPGIGQTKIAFKDQAANGDGEIYVADFDGHNPTAVTTDGAIVAAPAWVPGKLALYYTSYKLYNPDIFYHDLTTGQRHVFARFPGLNNNATVSRDGRVAMILSMNGDPNVWVCDADGSHLKQLTFTRADDSCPCWSPDGQWILFATKIHSRRLLAKVPADGGDVQVVHTTGVPNPTDPDYSPDGKWIAFTSQGSTFNICVMPADGSAAPVTLVGGQHPSWSPNSRTLVYNQAVGYRQVLSVLDVFTRQHKNAGRVSGDNSEPAWAK